MIAFTHTLYISLCACFMKPVIVKL